MPDLEAAVAGIADGMVLMVGGLARLTLKSPALLDASGQRMQEKTPAGLLPPASLFA